MLTVDLDKEYFFIATLLFTIHLLSGWYFNTSRQKPYFFAWLHSDRQPFLTKPQITSLRSATTYPLTGNSTCHGMCS